MARLLIVHDHRTWVELLAHALMQVRHELVATAGGHARCCRLPRRITTSS